MKITTLLFYTSVFQPVGHGHGHGRQKYFFQGGIIVDFSSGSQEDFSRGGQKWRNFIFPLETR